MLHITIVVQLKFGSPKSPFKTLTVEETGTKTEFWLVKIKWDNAKYSL